MIKSVVALGFFLVSLSIAQSQEWTRFRGPNGTGVGEISNLPAEFSSANYDWIIRLEGQGHSSPVLWNKKLFLTTAIPKKHSRKVVCYHAISGQELWEWESILEEHNLHDFNNFASATPTVDQDRVYLAWGSGDKTQAVAIDHEGKEVWSREWSDFSSDHGFGTSPVLISGKLIFHTDSVLKGESIVICLDPKTGKTEWEFKRKTDVENEKHLTAYNTPVSMMLGGKEIVIVLQTNDGWRGLDLETGEPVWSYDGEYQHRSVGSIVTGDGILFATFGSGGTGKAATGLRPVPDDPPEVLYTMGLSDGLSYVPTPLIHEGLLYLWGDGGILTCRDAVTGKLVYKKRVDGNFFSSPIIADGKIYCASRDGEMVTVKVGPDFEILGRSRLESGVNATPAIANNRLYVRTNTHLFSVSGK